MDDQRDYAEEAWCLAEMEREGLAEMERYQIYGTNVGGSSWVVVVDMRRGGMGIAEFESQDDAVKYCNDKNVEAAEAAEREQAGVESILCYAFRGREYGHERNHRGMCVTCCKDLNERNHHLLRKGSKVLVRIPGLDIVFQTTIYRYLGGDLFDAQDEYGNVYRLNTANLI